MKTLTKLQVEKILALAHDISIAYGEYMRGAQDFAYYMVKRQQLRDYLTNLENEK